MALSVKDFISIKDITRQDFETLFARTDEMIECVRRGEKPLEGESVVVATLFFEPSTRTRLSFETAAQRLGARVINFASVEASSMAKGETFSDTIRIVDGYADLLVIRHPLEGSARLAAYIADSPVINAGDGGNQHPTQTLLDLYTIRRLKGRIEGLNVFLLGDLKHARTMRSLLYGLGMFGANATLVAPKGLNMDRAVIEEVREKFGIEVVEKDKADLSDCDVLYVCRIQKERFFDKYEAEKLQKEFRVSGEMLASAKDDMIILHPLPKIDEIEPSVDSSKFAKYFEQAKYGVPTRMALICELIGKGGA
ncbi:MAG: aspartate carbamoyltransferase [Candidatus Micrarchaeia archaeon]